MGAIGRVWRGEKKARGESPRRLTKPASAALRSRAQSQLTSPSGKRTQTGRHTRGVLVAWDPSVLICEDQEVLLHHRVVRVRLRALGDAHFP